MDPVSRELADALIEIIKERMAERGLSVNKLAGAIGVPQATLFRHFAGEGNIPVDEFDAIATALDETFEELTTAARRRM